MKVLANNCVSTIKVPRKAKSGNKVAYNPVLDVFVTMDAGDGISAWNPVSRKVFHLDEDGADGQIDFVLVPGNSVAISCSSWPSGGDVQILSLENLSKRMKPKLKIGRSCLGSHSFPGCIALSPQKSLLVAESVSGFLWTCEVFTEWEELKVVTSEIYTDDTPNSHRKCDGIGSLCCTPDYYLVKGIFNVDYDDCFYSLLFGKICPPTPDQIKHKADSNGKDGDSDIDNNNDDDDHDDDESDDDDSNDKNSDVASNESDSNESCHEDDDNGKNDDFNVSDDDDDEDDNSSDEDDDVCEEIDFKLDALVYCILDGREYKLKGTTEFIHDGQNLILAKADKILLLETLTNGSTAHLIASGLKPIQKGLGINHKGQLMVCDGKRRIKFFDYKCNPRSLQELCRCCILEAIPQSFIENVRKLTIPETLKDYLLFKDKGY